MSSEQIPQQIAPQEHEPAKVDSPVIVALVPSFKENGCTVGLGYIDLTKRVLGLTEFLDDSHFTYLKSVLVALGCKICLLPMDSTKSSESRSLNDAMSRCGVMVTERKKTEFRGCDVVQDLGRLVRGSMEPVRDLVTGFELAPGALGALLSHTELLADESNYENYNLEQYSLDSYMRVDSAAVQALDVMEGKTDANNTYPVGHDRPVSWLKKKKQDQDLPVSLWWLKKKTENSLNVMEGKTDANNTYPVGYDRPVSWLKKKKQDQDLPVSLWWLKKKTENSVVKDDFRTPPPITNNGDDFETPSPVTNNGDDFETPPPVANNGDDFETPPPVTNNSFEPSETWCSIDFW